MSNNEDTVVIAAMPKPSTMLGLGATATAAVGAWSITLTGIIAAEANESLSLIGGLAACIVATNAAVLAWSRYTLARNAANHHRELLHVLAGQHAFVMAEMRRALRTVEERSGQASAERQAISAKLTKIMEQLPTYYDGVADTFEQIGGNVTDIGRARVPRQH